MAEEIVRILAEAELTAAGVGPAAARSTCYAQIAEACLEYGNQAGSLAALTEALKAAEKIKYPEEKAKRLAWIARLYQALGESRSAQEQFTRAVLLAGAAETASKKIGALYDVACEYVDAGLNAEAEKTLATLSATVSAAEKEVDVVCELVNVAGLYIDMNKNVQADAVLKDAHQINAETEDPWFKAERGIEIAQAFAAASESRQTDELITESLASLALVDKENRPYFRLKMADVYIILGKRQAAIELLRKTADEAGENESNYIQAQSLTEIAEKYLRLNDISAATGILNTIAGVIEKIEDGKDKIAILVKTSALLQQAGQEPKAISLTGQSQILAESLVDPKSRLFCLGIVAVSWAKLKATEKVLEVVSRLE
ncbi:MAG TPA: hypothetical protein VF318_07125, partial [Dehalococcoidales bacterium]